VIRDEDTAWFSEVLRCRKRHIYGQQEMGLVEDVIIGPYSGQQGRGVGPRRLFSR
jgi:hypothetical protein